MASPSDSLLIRAGLVRAEQLAEARKLCARSGGTVGEWLVRLGAVTEEQLVDFYHRRLMVPWIKPEQLAQVPAPVLLAVPPEMATEFLVFPVDFDPEGGITLAMADPADTHVAEEVAFYAGRACHRAVAAASELRRAVERSYRSAPAALSPSPDDDAVPTPIDSAGEVARRRALATEPMGIVSDTPPPSPSHDEPVLLTRRKVDRPAVILPALPRARRRAITHPRVTLSPSRLEAVTEPDLPRMEPAPASAIDDDLARRRTLPGIPLVPDLPLAQLQAAQSREEVAAALLGYAEQLAPVAALLVMRGGALTGHDSRGDGVSREGVRGLVLRLEQPSLFRDVVSTRLPYCGALPDGPAGQDLLSALGPGAQTGDALLLPITVGGKVIAVLCAASIAAPLPDLALRELADAAGAAYERLIRLRKQ